MVKVIFNENELGTNKRILCTFAFADSKSLVGSIRHRLVSNSVCETTIFVGVNDFDYPKIREAREKFENQLLSKNEKYDLVFDIDNLEKFLFFRDYKSVINYDYYIYAPKRDYVIFSTHRGQYRSYGDSFDVDLIITNGTLSKKDVETIADMSLKKGNKTWLEKEPLNAWWADDPATYFRGCCYLSDNSELRESNFIQPIKNAFVFTQIEPYAD